MKLALRKRDLHRPLVNCKFFKNYVYCIGIKLYDKLLVIYIVCSWTKDTFTDHLADF
jgi:hypothetical protein